METTQENCIFCKIVSGEAPAYTVYEDADTYAFLTIGPVNPGHILIVPKVHYTNAFDMPEDLFAKVSLTAQKMARSIPQSTGAQDVNITMNNGPHSGQVVFHAHMHVIPRYPNDGHMVWSHGEYKEGEAQEITEKIKKVLG